MSYYQRNDGTQISQVNSLLHHSGVAKSSTSFSWCKGGKGTASGWQVTVWSYCGMVSCSGVVIFPYRRLNYIVIYGKHNPCTWLPDQGFNFDLAEITSFSFRHAMSSIRLVTDCGHPLQLSPSLSTPSSFTDLCRETDNNLFDSILNSRHHVLRHLLPPPSQASQH